jgi:hypothetical protein
MSTDNTKQLDTQALFDKDAAAKAISLDLMSAERFGAQRLLEKANELYPLDKAGMPADFKGNHSVTLVNGKLQINIWWNGKCWPLHFSGSLEAPPRTTLPRDFPPVEAILQK